MTYKIPKQRVKEAKTWKLPVENIIEADRKTYIGKRKEPKGKDVVYIEDDEGQTHAITIHDLAYFFIQARGFPSILKLGNVYGEGQSGGREVTEMAQRTENAFVEKYGEDYQEKMKKAVNEVESGKTKIKKFKEY